METYILQYHFKDDRRTFIAITRANSSEEAETRIKEDYSFTGNLVVYDIRAFSDRSLEVTSFTIHESYSNV